MLQEFTDKPGNMKLVRASVPLSEMFSYVSTLRGMSKGRAQYTMQLEKYEVGGLVERGGAGGGGGDGWPC